MKTLFTSITLALLLFDTGFKKEQLKYERVRKAFEEKSKVVDSCLKNGLTRNHLKIFIRAFKQEKVLEVWASEKDSNAFSLIKMYPFCSSSGSLGPKNKEGDYQIPEGIYHIQHFNPTSHFHLSLGINYPNARDKMFCDKSRPGGNIYIHGNCVTIGCIPITDDKIKELYVMAVEARNNGQEKIPVHIFPARLTQENFQKLNSISELSQHTPLWNDLKEIYNDFENTHSLKRIGVNKKGQYYLAPN